MAVRPVTSSAPPTCSSKNYEKVRFMCMYHTETAQAYISVNRPVLISLMADTKNVCVVILLDNQKAV